MPKLYAECIKLYRSVVPASVRHLIGKALPGRTGWTQAESATGKWHVFEYEKPRWDTEYLSDKWTYLRGIQELSRYSVVVGYARFLHPEGSVLDLGCGEGILQERLGSTNYRRYLGVDVSQAAIELARSRQNENTGFVCADVATFVPDAPFDVIVFNEVLYYLDDPVGVMRHYERHLKPGGIFILSMFVNEQTTQNWSTLAAAYPFLDETRAGNAKSGFSWFCGVWQRAKDAPAAVFADAHSARPEQPA